MKLFLIDKNKISKLRIPEQIDDSFTASYSNDFTKCFISFEGKDNKWYIKSNGNVNVYSDNKEVEELEVKTCFKYDLRIIGYNEPISAFFLPSSETMFKFDVKNQTDISIGSNPKCNVVFTSPSVAPVQSVIKKAGDNYFITSIDDKQNKTFVNGTRVITQKLDFGDFIFMGGLRIIWLDTMIAVNNPDNRVKINGFNYIKGKEEVNGQILPVSEEEKNVSLYEEHDYFTPYPVIREKIVGEQKDIIEPPSTAKQETLPWILTVGTSLTMLSSSLVMVFNIGYSVYNNKSEIIRLIPQIFSVVMMIFGSLLFPKLLSNYQKKTAKKKTDERIKKYKDYLQQQVVEIETFVKTEKTLLNQEYMDTTKCYQAVVNKNSDFWRRQIDDADFLTIRLGTGKVSSSLVINAPERTFNYETDELLEIVYSIKEKYEAIDDMPIVLPLRNYNITSFICTTHEDSLNKYINQLMLQLLAMHSCLDLKIAIFTTNTNAHKWNYLRYVPHLFSDDKSIRLFATNEEEANYISGFLESELMARQQTNGNEGGFAPYYLIITDNYIRYKDVPIIHELVEKDNKALAFIMLDFENGTTKIPISSKSFITFDDKKGAAIEKNFEKDAQRLFDIKDLDYPIDTTLVSTKLANIPIMSKSGPNQLPDSLEFLDMFNVSKIEQLNILDRWQNHNPVNSLSTVVGVHRNGEDFRLDLHEKYHGPHGLIAGTTGSGKSEFIITYILSMIINYHPYEVQFVLIDYKGGGLAGAFENKETGVKIPHLVGTITNLSLSDMNRSMVSIQSELRRRQSIFNEVRDKLGEGTVDIYKYQKFYREGKVDKPLAHLFIICDEFAELKSQQPEFLGELVSASRIGRSLGIHLILATQKPSGQVNDQMWANSKFKVCLKVQDRSDSMEMLKRPEAAEIKEAGRFFLQVGYNDYFDIGQSGYSGAKYVPSDRIISKVDESLNYIDNTGYVIKTVKDKDENKVQEVDHGEQITNIVKSIYNIGVKEKIVTQKLWLDAIPPIILDKELRKKYNYKPTAYNINPLIGEFDDPTNQYQGALNIDLSGRGGLLLYGMVGSGKENFLTNLIRSIIAEHTPEEVHIYIDDCDSGSLRIFSSFPHVGEVITISDVEKTYDMFEYAGKEIARRKDLFADYAGSYNDYITNSGKKEPSLIFVINNYDNFLESYSKLNDSLDSLFREGEKYGIIFILSIVTPSIIRSRVSQFFGNKVCLQLADASLYRDILGAPKGLVPASFNARGLIGLEYGVFEFQTSTFTEKSQYTNYLRQYSKMLNESYKSRAPEIPSIPNVVYLEHFIDKVKSSTNLPIGYNVMNKDITYLDFNIQPILTIAAMDIDEIKMAFMFALIEMLNSQLNTEIDVVDMADAYTTEISGIVPVKDKFEEYFNKMYTKITTENENTESYFFILGASFLKSQVSKELYAKMAGLFSNMDKHPHNHIILLDVYNGYKALMTDDWFANKVNNSTGIWLGDGVGSQSLLKINNISYDDKNEYFDFMAFAIFNGKYQIIKHVVKRWLNEDEE